MTNKNKDIVYKEVFNNFPKIQNSHQSIIGRLQNNNFIRCNHFIFDNYYTKFFSIFYYNNYLRDYCLSNKMYILQVYDKTVQRTGL